MTAAEVIAAALAGQTGTVEWTDVPIVVPNPKARGLGRPQREMFAPGCIDLAYLRSLIEGTGARPWTKADAE